MLIFGHPMSGFNSGFISISGLVLGGVPLHQIWTVHDSDPMVHSH